MEKLKEEDANYKIVKEQSSNKLSFNTVVYKKEDDRWAYKMMFIDNKDSLQEAEEWIKADSIDKVEDELIGFYK